MESESAQRLVDLIRQISVSLPPELVDAIRRQLGHHQGPFGDSLRWKLEDLAGTTARRQMMQRLLEAAAAVPTMTPSALAIALGAARPISDSNAGEVELVWTGPSPKSVMTRMTDQIVLAAIERATSELLIVSFAIHEDARWVAALREAIARGVSVMFVVETSSSGRVKSDGLLLVLQDLIGACSVWTWALDRRPSSEKGLVGTLHAKCIVADRDYALVSSANLTGHAMNLNIELGVAFTGGQVPSQTRLLFEEMKLCGVLTKVI